MNYREKIRKAIECPQFGNETYGEWGSLRLEQRVLIKRLLDELDSADNYFKKVYLENQQIKDNWNKLKEFIAKEYYMYLPLEATAKSITILIDKMQELEGSDSNVKD